MALSDKQEALLGRYLDPKWLLGMITVIGILWGSLGVASSKVSAILTADERALSLERVIEVQDSLVTSIIAIEAYIISEGDIPKQIGLLRKEQRLSRVDSRWGTCVSLARRAERDSVAFGRSCDDERADSLLALVN